MTTTRRLVVMRHAKAEPYADTDADRSLTRRGHTDAEDAGGFLAGNGVLPDVALVSSAVRTRQTWEHVHRATGGEPRVELSDELYDASQELVLETLQALPDEVGTAMYVGHNPAAGSLAYALNDGEGDPMVVRTLLEGFPPAAVAVFEVAGSWAELAEGAATLTHFHAPGR